MGEEKWNYTAVKVLKVRNGIMSPGQTVLTMCTINTQVTTKMQNVVIVNKQQRRQGGIINNMQSKRRQRKGERYTNTR